MSPDRHADEYNTESTLLADALGVVVTPRAPVLVSGAALPVLTNVSISWPNASSPSPANDTEVMLDTVVAVDAVLWLHDWQWTCGVRLVTYEE